MFDRQKYIEYLSRTRKGNETINEYIKTLDNFHTFIREHKEANPPIDNLMLVDTFLAEYNVEHMVNIFRGVMKCLTEYADYILKNSKDNELLSIAEAIRQTLSSRYRQTAINFAASRKKLIIPIPGNAVIEPKHLNALENDEFIAAFRELQNCIISIYDDIEKSPFEWGFPEYEQTEVYYHRIAEFLLGFGRYSVYDNDRLIVDKKAFSVDYTIKKHRKQELIINRFNNLGFVIDGFSSKNQSFSVSYPDNDNLIRVLHSYAKAHSEYSFAWATDLKHVNNWIISKHKYSFSYRYIEKRTPQSYEIPFLVELDYATEKGREVLLYIRAEAKKHGYFIDVNDPLEYMFHDSVKYKNGDKLFLYAGENQSNNYSGKLTWGISANLFLKDVFVSEKEKMAQLISRFPEAFKNTQAEMRMRKRYKGEVFWLENLTLEDVKDILEMFKIENKIK